MNTKDMKTYHQWHYHENKEKYQKASKARYQKLKAELGIKDRSTHTITIGERFGRWTVIENPNERNEKSKVLCVAQCDCGTIRYVIFRNLITGITRSCGCLALEKKRTAKGLGMLNQLYANYERKAQEADREFTITKDEFHKLTSQNCYYCGVSPNRTISKPDINGSYTYNGIDRFHNDLGYSLSNCVTCCAECNKAKHSMTAKAYIALCHRVVKLHTLK